LKLRLKELRKARNLNQDIVAAAIGKTTGHYSGIERGEKNLYFEDAVKIAQCFQCSLDELVDSEAGPHLVSNNPNPVTVDKDLLMLAGEVVSELIDQGVVDAGRCGFWDSVVAVYAAALEMKEARGSVSVPVLTAKWVQGHDKQ